MIGHGLRGRGHGLGYGYGCGYGCGCGCGCGCDPLARRALDRTSGCCCRLARGRGHGGSAVAAVWTVVRLHVEAVAVSAAAAVTFAEAAVAAAVAVVASTRCTLCQHRCCRRWQRGDAPQLPRPLRWQPAQPSSCVHLHYHLHWNLNLAVHCRRCLRLHRHCWLRPAPESSARHASGHGGILPRAAPDGSARSWQAPALAPPCAVTRRLRAGVGAAQQHPLTKRMWQRVPRLWRLWQHPSSTPRRQRPRQRRRSW